MTESRPWPQRSQWQPANPERQPCPFCPGNLLCFSRERAVELAQLDGFEELVEVSSSVRSMLLAHGHSAEFVELAIESGAAIYVRASADRIYLVTVCDQATHVSVNLGPTDQLDVPTILTGVIE